MNGVGSAGTCRGQGVHPAYFWRGETWIPKRDHRLVPSHTFEPDTIPAPLPIYPSWIKFQGMTHNICMRDQTNCTPDSARRLNATWDKGHSWECKPSIARGTHPFGDSCCLLLGPKPGHPRLLAAALALALSSSLSHPNLRCCVLEEENRDQAPFTAVRSVSRGQDGSLRPLERGKGHVPWGRKAGIRALRGAPGMERRTYDFPEAIFTCLSLKLENSPINSVYYR